ncbi:glutaredoxin [Vulcanisaeta moutnovskia 768-28]|uniref:Glutaredoxin n=1 Tax=Vulcanisaeta moutnovskia (strain 768-28) TaxID=985053 RepID=F0QVC5_VULM7|nr:thioredoxin family protein [Vulcanisaeta moutnovskia]ADY02027.1 glutaredoxin [Vulcanisaeta moutnovskia 768-28]
MNKTNIEIFIHPTCSTCHTLIRLLKQWNYLDIVKIIDTSRDPYTAMERGVRSVPSIFINGELVFAGIVDFKRLKAMLDGEYSSSVFEGDLRELEERFFRGVLDSVATALWLYVNEDCNALLKDREFTMAITNISIYSNREELYDELRRYLSDVNTCREAIRSREERFFAVITKNFTREIYWLYNRFLSWNDISKLYNKEVIAHWMIVRSALGRVGLRVYPISNEKFKEKVEKVYNYMSQAFDEYMRQVIDEQAGIFNDLEYVEVIDNTMKNIKVP